MSFLQNASIRTKILSVILPLCVVGFGASAFMASRYKGANAQYYEFIAKNNVGLLTLSRANRNIAGVELGAFQLIASEPGSVAYKAANIEYERQKELMLARLGEAKVLLPEASKLIDDAVKDVTRLVQVTDHVVDLVSTNRYPEAKVLILEADNIVTENSKGFLSFMDRSMANVLAKADEIHIETNSTIAKSLIAIGSFFLACTIIALLLISKGITAPIARLRERMASLAGGDTAPSIGGIDRRDEVGQMAAAVQVFRENAIERLRLEHETETNRSMSEKEQIERGKLKAKEAADVQFAVDNLAAGLSKLSDGDVSYRISEPFTASLDVVRTDFNSSADKLQSALNSVAVNARSIDVGASEIKSAADDLAKRTEQQAAAVEQTAAALEEITTAVKDATKRAQEAGQLVSRARSGAEQSGDVVRRAVNAMELIDKSSSEISNIIGVIDEIAFQTNLLALNAGVEAARAGEAGKGFAVVAQEVRELAQRSAAAAKAIKALITASNAQVEEGVQLVGDTGKALHTIISEVQEVNRHVSAIAESAQEQSSGLQQINAAVNQMDQDTQRNAAMVEETNAASHHLAREVASLNLLLAQFRLAEGGHTYATSVAVVPAANNAHRPSPSPVRALNSKISSAFSGNAAVETKGDWQEF